MTSFIDTHCHLDRLALTPKAAVEQAQDAGVRTVVTIAVDAESVDFVDGFTQAHPEVFGSLGVHPHDAKDYTESLGAEIQARVQRNPKIRAMGEMGLDYHYNFSEAEIQQTVFRKQLQSAEMLRLPVVLHTREAEQDTLRILEEHPVSRKGVAHSFTGSQEMADALLAMGWFIGINGIVTFKNAEALRKVVHSLPLDRLLLETDAPYLTPVPFRGKPNSPAQVPVIAEFLAENLGIPVAQLAAQTSENARRLFALPA